MKLKNKKTGEIIELLAKPSFVKLNNNYLQSEVNTFDSLAELNAEWEDYIEPKGYWSYDTFDNDVTFNSIVNEDDRKADQEIGNYFGTLEEAEKAVEKLKAWKFLKDMGLKIEGIRYRDNKNYIEWSISQKVRNVHFMSETFNDALHLLFGGEE